MDIGIDQSYNSTGLVALNRRGTIKEFTCIRLDEPTLDRFDLSVLLAQKIFEFCKENDAERIAIEGLAFGMRGSVTRDLAGLQFVIINKLRAESYSPLIVPPNSLKKFATSSGRAKKPDMYNALPEDVKPLFDEQFKKTTGLYDVTDAYWLAKYSFDNAKNG